MGLVEAFHWFKADARARTAVVLVNLAGIAYGFYYYLPQFAATPAYLWPFVPDSPMAVLFAQAALVLYAFGRRYDWLDALAFVANVKVGLWTAFVLLYYDAAFAIFESPLTNLNFYLFWLHLGMALEAMVFVHDLRGVPGRVLAAVLAWFLVNDWLDYGLGFVQPHLAAACNGLRPHTIPCVPGQETVLTWVTVALSVASVAWLWAMTRPRAAERGSARAAGV